MWQREKATATGAEAPTGTLIFRQASHRCASEAKYNIQFWYRAIKYAKVGLVEKVEFVNQQCRRKFSKWQLFKIDKI